MLGNDSAHWKKSSHQVSIFAHFHSESPWKLRTVRAVKLWQISKIENLKTRTIQALKIGANCSEYLEIIIYEISSLKIFSQNSVQKLRASLGTKVRKSLKGILFFKNYFIWWIIYFEGAESRGSNHLVWFFFVQKICTIENSKIGPNFNM